MKTMPTKKKSKNKAKGAGAGKPNQQKPTTGKK
jgi:hypothetical protein